MRFRKNKKKQPNFKEKLATVTAHFNVARRHFCPIFYNFKV